MNEEPLDPHIYRALHTGTFGDRQFYIDLVKKKIHQSPQKLRVLELGCGSGRILCELAKLNVHLTGIDLSREALEFCHDQLIELGRSVLMFDHDSSDQGQHIPDEQVSTIYLIQQDFTNLTDDLLSNYDLVLITYNSIYCLPSEKHQIDLIKSALSFLNQTGELWIDGYALPDPDEYAYESDQEFSPLTVITLPPTQARLCRDLGVEEKDDFDIKKQLLTVSYRYSAPEEEAHLEPLHYKIEQIKHRYLYPWQFPKICLLANANLQSMMADFGGDLLKPTEDLRSYAWGIEAEHWIACLTKDM